MKNEVAAQAELDYSIIFVDFVLVRSIYPDAYYYQRKDALQEEARFKNSRNPFHGLGQRYEWVSKRFDPKDRNDHCQDELGQHRRPEQLIGKVVPGEARAPGMRCLTSP